MFLSAECFKSILKGLRGDRDSGKGVQQRRKSPRVGVRARTEITREAMNDSGAQTIDVIIRDLSAAGLGMLTAERLNNGEHVWITLPMANGAGCIVAEYIVCYCSRITAKMYSCGAELHNYVEQAEKPGQAALDHRTERSAQVGSSHSADDAAGRKASPGSQAA